MSPTSPYTTISEVIKRLGLVDWHNDVPSSLENVKPSDFKLFRWPPDVFAVAAVLLRDSGAYVRVAEEECYASARKLIKKKQCDTIMRLAFERWMLPTQRAVNGVTAWPEFCQEVAKEWDKCVTEDLPPPRAVQELLAYLKTKCADQTFFDLMKPDNHTWMIILQLLCLADQASASVGLNFELPDIPTGSISVSATDSQRSIQAAGKKAARALSLEFRKRMKKALKSIRGQAIIQLLAQLQEMQTDNIPHGSTLTKLVDASQVCVLPKMRTSQRGVTMRSLTLHLAAVPSREMEPVWVNSLARSIPEQSENRAYNLLLIPHPYDIIPSQFKALDVKDAFFGRPPADRHQFFGYTPDASASLPDVDRLIKAAQKKVGRVHGIVMPEVSISTKQLEEFNRINAMDEINFFACGLYEPPSDGMNLAGNYAYVRLNPDRKNQRVTEAFDMYQPKHHRWALDSGQICDYSLGCSLSPVNKTWWEGIRLESPRRLGFFTLDDHCVFSVLICEDLARPDPVGDIIRAVGPNLVICLLLDGPQLTGRWSARHATALADDPGCSVLTLTSLGMTKLSRQKERLHESSRVVAMWREPQSSPVELKLPDNAEALVLTLVNARQVEHTIDGRSDNNHAGVLKFGGLHHI